MVTPRPSRFPPFRAADRCFSVYSTQVRQGRVELRTCFPCHPLVPFTQVPSRIFLRSMDPLKGRGLSISPNLYAPPQHVVSACVAWVGSAVILVALGGESMQDP